MGKIAVTFSGSQGSGKTTLRRAISRFLTDHGFTVSDGQQVVEHIEPDLIVEGDEKTLIALKIATTEPTMQERVNRAMGDDLPKPDNGANRTDARR